jgi:carboxyl-terminal processing protease
MRITEVSSSNRFQRALAAALIASGTLAFPTILRAEELPRVAAVSEAPANTSFIVRAVRTFIEKEHISHPQFNDEMSYRGFDLFLRNVDPLKMYLLQSDIDEFKVYQAKLDDLIKVGDVSFAYKVYKRYLARLEKMMPYIHEQIDAEHDFSVDESILADAKEIPWAADENELKDRIRKSIKLNILSLKADGKSDKEIKETLHKRYVSVENIKKQTDVDELLELYLTSLTTSLDPHTTYMSPREQEDFGVHLKLEFMGIGATLRPDGGQTVVENIVTGGAADRDGRLKAGDHIVAVSQDDGSPAVETMDMKLQDVVSMIRGPKGTKVRLHVKPNGTGDTQVYEITRDLIKLEDEAARGEVIEHGSKPDGSKYKIGYINLPSFYLDMDAARRNVKNYRSTRRDLQNIINGFKQQGVEAIVLDLSKNGGGSLQEAIAVTGLFIESGPVVQVKEPGGHVEPLEDEDRNILWSGPLVVKISQMSASASEIFAGAIQDYDRGLIVGDPKTHGKGTVQTLLDLGQQLGMSKSYGGLKLTIQQFYLPNGRSTQLEGVSSDIVLPSLISKLDISESDLDYPLPADKVPARPHKHYRMVDEGMKLELQRAANERIAKNPEFEKLLSQIDSYVRQKEEKSISLKESNYMARRKETNSEKVEEEQLTSKPDKSKIFNKNFYNEELLNITRDYIDALRRTNKIVGK